MRVLNLPINKSSIHADLELKDQRLDDFARLTFQNTNLSFHNLKIYRLSPFGVEIITSELINFSSVEPIILSIGSEEIESSAYFVGQTGTLPDGRFVFGLRFDFTKPRDSNFEEERTEKRFKVGNLQNPNGYFKNPFKINELVVFNIEEISKNGVYFTTSLRNKLIVPGMRIDSTVNFPTYGDLNCKFQIQNSRIIKKGNEKVLGFGAKVLDNYDKKEDILGDFLFQFSDCKSIKELKESGFNVKKASSALEFQNVKSETDYKDIKLFREFCYGRAGKIRKEQDKEELSDSYDTHSRIVFCRYKNEVICSARLTFPEGKSQKFELDDQVEIPKNFPNRNEIVELSRICTHPDFRASDLLFHLIKHCMLQVACSDVKWIFGAAEERLVPAYEKMGWRRLDTHFINHDMGSKKHYLLLGNKFDMITGRSTSPKIWNLLYSDLINFISSKNLLDIDPSSNLRMNMYRAMKPFAGKLKLRSKL